MKRLSFVDALVLALVLSVSGGVTATMLGPLCSGVLLSRALCTALAFVYVLFLIMRSRLRSGRVSLLATWLLAALAIVLFSPSLLVMVIAHLVLIWLTRGLLFHRSVLSALADLGLCALSLATAAWALLETGSVFISLWCLLLVQAACVLLPARLGNPACAGTEVDDNNTRFAHAARAAEQALHALSSPR